MLLDTVTRELTEDDRVVVLQRFQCRMIATLATIQPGYLSDRMFESVMWPADRLIGTPETALRVAAHQANKAIIASGMAPLIERMRSLGYRLTRPVSVIGKRSALVVPEDMRDLLHDLLRSHPDASRAGRLLNAIS